MYMGWLVVVASVLGAGLGEEQPLTSQHVIPAVECLYQPPTVIAFLPH